jgi:hypothetical protein
MQWFPDWFNDVGFIVTFLGFAFTIPQIIGIKRRIAKKLSVQDNLINISKSIEIISELKNSVKNGDFSLVDKKISEIKGHLMTCKRVHKEKGNEVIKLLQSLTDSQQNVNKVLINPVNSANFDSELFFSTLDETRDLFAEIIEKCRYE